MTRSERRLSTPKGGPENGGHLRIHRLFLERQFEEGMALSAASDLLELVPVDGPAAGGGRGGAAAGGGPPSRYLAHFRCQGLARNSGGDVSEADHFVVGVWFPSDYLRHVDPAEVVTWLGPPEAFHPNIRASAAAICVGRLNPGTSLTEILYQLFEIITWHKVTMREDDALDREACVWARRNPDRFPVERRPLKRRTLALTIETDDRIEHNKQSDKRLEVSE